MSIQGCVTAATHVACTWQLINCILTVHFCHCCHCNFVQGIGGGQLRRIHCDYVSKSHCCRPTAIPCERAFQPPFAGLRRQKLQGVFLFVFVGGGGFCEGDSVREVGAPGDVAYGAAIALFDVINTHHTTRKTIHCKGTHELNRVGCGCMRIATTRSNGSGLVAAAVQAHAVYRHMLVTKDASALLTPTRGV